MSQSIIGTHHAPSVNSMGLPSPHLAFYASIIGIPHLPPSLPACLDSSILGLCSRQAGRSHLFLVANAWGLIQGYWALNSVYSSKENDAKL